MANTFIRKIYSPKKEPVVVVEREYFTPPRPETPHNWPTQPIYIPPPRPMPAVDLDLPKSYSSPSRLSSSKLADTAEYIELVKRESDKFKKRDDLANKLSPDLKFSSLSSNEKNELINCLKAKVSLFREVERARTDLAENSGFSLSELFRIVKKNQLAGGVSFDEFKDLFQRIGMAVDEKLIRLVFVRNDYDNDGTLSFFEFSELVGPFKPALREDLNRRVDNGYLGVSDYPPKIKQAISRCLKSLIEFEKETDSTREVTQHRLYSLFNLIDQSNKNLLVLQDISEILQNHGFSATEMELIALIRKFDFNMDGKISMVEFINEMSPLRNSKPFETLRNKGF